MLVFKNALLIDGTGSAPVENAIVVVEGNKILEIGRNIEIPENATAIDLNGKTLMPGLIEAHLHAGANTIARFTGKDKSGNYGPMRETLHQYGITSVRCCGDCQNDILEVRDEVASGKLTGPRIVTCGGSFQKKGGHPNATVWFGDSEIVDVAALCPETQEEAREMVHKQVEAGVDFIKIIWSDINPMHLEINMPKLELDIIEAIIDESHKLNMKVAVHCENGQDALAVVKAGANAVEHLIFPTRPQFEVYDELFSLMIKQGTFLTPTATISVEHSAHMPESVPGHVSYATPVYKKAFDMGVKITTGTDSFTHGEALICELEHMVKNIGIPEIDAIKSVTKMNSELLGKADELGTVEVGKLADLLIVSGNPIESISNIRNIELVIQDGKIVVDNMLAK